MLQTKVKKGSYGTVTLREKTATKTFKNKFYIRELCFMQLCKKFPHICAVQSYDIGKKEIVMPRYQYDLEELSKILQLDERIYISQFIIEQMLNTLNCLHYNGIVHGDIKPANIFCNYDSETKKINCYLGDFSISRSKNFVEDYAGYGLLSPPENGILITKQSDIWMLGATIIKFITKTSLDGYEKSREGSLPFNYYYPNIILPNNIKQKLQELMKFDPLERLSFKHVNDLQVGEKISEILSECSDKNELEYEPITNQIINLVKLPPRILLYTNNTLEQINQEIREELFNTNSVDNIIKARRIKLYLTVDKLLPYIFDYIAQNDFLKQVNDQRYIKDIKLAFSKYNRNKNASNYLTEYFF